MFPKDQASSMLVVYYLTVFLPKKTQEEVIKMDLSERRVSKDLARDKLAWKSIF